MATAFSHRLPRPAQDRPSIVTVMRYAVCALVAFIVLAVAGCGSSTDGAASATSSAPPPTSAPAAKAKDHVAGMVSSLSGTAIQVIQQNGGTTVDFTSSTRIRSISRGQLSDVSAGGCVIVRPTPDSDTGS